MSDHDSLHYMDLDQITNQIGYAIMNASDGSLLKPPSGSLSSIDTEIIYKLLLEMGPIVNDGNKDEALKRVNVQGGNGISYTIVLSNDGLIHIVKKGS
jgi:hypothetical protein